MAITGWGGSMTMVSRANSLSPAHTINQVKNAAITVLQGARHGRAKVRLGLFPKLTITSKQLEVFGSAANFHLKQVELDQLSIW